jgi:hypothetical protein
MMTGEFKAGDRVLHASFGKGLVVACASAAERDSVYDQVQVKFDSGRTKWLALLYAGLVLLDEHDAPLRLGEDDAQWPSSTFLFDKVDVEHYMGSHWEPFFDDRKEIFGRRKHSPRSMRSCCKSAKSLSRQSSNFPLRELPSFCQ